MVCIGTSYTGRKFGDFLGLLKLESCFGCIEGLIGKDERDGEMVVWFPEVLAIPGGKRAEFYA